MTLEHAIIQLIQHDRFFAEFILQMDRRVDRKIKYGTACVTMEPRPTLIYHPKFFEVNGILEGRAFLMHEVGHLILGHILRGKQVSGGKFGILENIAADLAVNCLIPNCPDEFNTYDEATGEVSRSKGATVNNFKEAYPKLEYGQTFEWYRDFLMQNGGGEGEGEPSEGLDDHSQWGEGNQEMTENIVKRMAQNALERADAAGKGPANNVRDLIKKLLTGPNQWRRELQRFPQDAEKCATEPTRRKRHKRFGLAVAGERILRKVKICAAIDVSGSVGGPLLDLFYSEIGRIEAAGAEVTAMFFDSVVQKVIPWSQIKTLKQVPGGGGTNFQPFLDEAARLKFDGVICLTDGLNADSITKPRFPVLWAVPKNFDYKPPFGKRIVLEEV